MNQQRQDVILPPLILPGLRAYMGDWVYYICFLKMQEISKRISIVKEIHSSESLRNLLQRELQNRSSEIAGYLLSQKQRFFNALVVGTYGGSPKWYEFDLSSAESKLGTLPDDIDGTIGFFRLDGTEKLFAIDGQHRVAGIKEALKKQPELGDEEVCVIFLAGVTQEHRNKNPAGFERTRRLFTTLNRYAKPVSKKDIIALDEDDIIAILTRQMVEEYPLFQGVISLGMGKNISPTDTRSFTTIVALYDMLDIYFRRGDWKTFKRFRKSEAEIEAFTEKAFNLWDTLIEYLSPLQDLQNAEAKETVVRKYRNEFGGHLLFRPIGILIVIKAVRELIDTQMSLASAVNAVSHIPLELSSEPWANLLWDTTNKRMITATENQKVGVKLLFYGAGGDLSHLGTSAQKLHSELAGLLKRGLGDVELRRYVRG